MTQKREPFLIDLMDDADSDSADAPPKHKAWSEMSDERATSPRVDLGIWRTMIVSMMHSKNPGPIVILLP